MGMSLEKWLEHGHDGLKSKIKVTSNTLAMEFDACAEFGIDPYEQIMTRPRDWRAAITAHHLGQSLIANMRMHDTRPKPKRGGKR
jgi:hypothetical protein